VKPTGPRSDLARHELSAARRVQPAHAMMQAPSSPFGGFDDGQPDASIWEMVDDRMRGRWRTAIVVGALLAGALATAGYFSAEPVYRSMGAVRVSDQVPVLLHETDLHTQHNPDRFRATQVQLIRNPRVIEEALRDDDVGKTELADTENAAKFVQDNLKVEPHRESELIYVAFEAENPVTAQIVTNAVLNAYYKIYGQYNGQDIPGTLQELRDNQRKFERDLLVLQKERRAIESTYQTSDFPTMQRQNMELMAQLDMTIRTLKRQLNRLGSAGEDKAALTPDFQALETMNPMLARRRDEWTQAQAAFDQIRGQHLPGSSLYMNLKQRADRTKELYDEEYRKTLDFWRSSGAKPMAASGAAIAPTPENLAALETEYSELAQRQQKLVSDIARRDDIMLEEQNIQKELDSIRDRTRKLEIEGKNLGRFINIASYGARDDEPYENARRKRAIIGAGLGIMASFGGFFLLGSVDRRAFGASQLMPKPGSQVPACLGVLPDLGASLSDPEASDVAAHCVHQIRNQIEALRDPHTGYVLAVTSPFQGDGKTSIVIALGWSYAAAGYKTLMIDCDLVGRSLTRQLGFVGREGLRDALATGEMNGSVSRMPVEHLSVVPAGVDSTVGPENIRRAHLERLVSQVREQYDVILVDTGPMFGSLESTPVAGVADGVLLSVRRGRSRNRLEDCMNRLHMMGAECVGVVLNCAWRSDCNRYVSETSLAAAEEERAMRPHANGSGEARQAAPGERNALVRAVQRSTRVTSVSETVR
jgi:Mrp family chromosome partitioning ATPase/capsular polysaccharide biosynthesis protein